ncbi:MAG: LPS O-antigen length regulator [Gammaproteobacteria bacterium]|nr:LPS O-antigen length regulator [Gammaproteobacteria bacterium]
MVDSSVGPESRHKGSDDLDLTVLFRVLWAGKWLIVGLSATATVLAIIGALMLPDIYRSEALLAPNQDEGASGLSALAAQYGGLASLAGINLSDGTSDKTALGVETLKSRKFVSDFIERRDLLAPLLAAKSWDPQSGELEFDPDVYDASTERWLREPEPPRESQPSLQEAYIEFMKILYVDEESKPGFVRVSVQHLSPVVAERWVTWLIEDINSTIMSKDVREAEQAIEYLNTQISKTSIADLQVVLFRLIEEQTKTIMFARVSPEYMFTTVDPAVAPELKAKPNRALIVLLALILGGMLGVVIVLLRNGLSGFADERS